MVFTANLYSCTGENKAPSACSNLQSCSVEIITTVKTHINGDSALVHML